MSTEYEAVMGLEIHARLKTATKMFCACSNDTWQAVPNEHICPVCAGFPGALPLVNSAAIQLGMRAALAFGCSIPLNCKFDRKSYFYPDLPSGYQISQYDEPLALKGQVSAFVNGEKKNFGITRLHLENDAGKLTHEGNLTLVDLNRAGSPLMEMVTEPDFRSPAEVSSFLKEIQRTLRLIQASDADMEKGMMRCDVNVSVRQKGASVFGTKVEVKNMNSFRNIEKALEYEIERQIALLEKGEKVLQETRGFDPETEMTKSQRSKEEAMDYRYFPEPDLPPLAFTEAEVAAVKAELPELPVQKMARYHESYEISLIDAETLVSDPLLCTFFEETADLSGNPAKAANWIISQVLAVLNEGEKTLSTLGFSAIDLANLIKLIDSGEISGKIAKEVFAEMKEQGGNPASIITKKGLSQISDPAEIEKLCTEVVAENAQMVEGYRNGKEKLFGAFVGQVMKKSAGRANPELVNSTLLRLLKK